MLLLSPNLSAILFCYGFATFLSINLISTFCTQFHLFALNFNFLHCLGLIDVLSPNQHAEIFACILLDHSSLCLSTVFFFSIHFVDLVVLKPKTRSYLTRGTQKVVPGRRDKVVPPARVALPAEVRQLGGRVVSPPRDELVILM